jgi:hypothetical protein
MSSVYSGDPSGVSNARTATVDGATNATPIVISTSSPHGFATGDVVVIADVGGNTAANGTWQITVVDGDDFELDGSVGSGAYTTGGTVVNVSLTPAVTLPSDGDTLDAASVNAALEACADRDQFLNLPLASLSDFDALRAIDTTNLDYGAKRSVRAQGIYELEDTGGGGPHSGAVDDEPWTIAPTTGPGVWRAATHFSATRTVMVPLGQLALVSTNGSGTIAADDRTGYSFDFGAVTATQLNQKVSGSRSLVASTTANKCYLFALDITSFMVDGATLSEATFRYTPASGHGALPALFPGLALVSYEPATSTVTVMRVPAQGFTYDTAASVVAYETLNRELTYTPTQGNVIDKAGRVYFVYVADEGGSANAIAGATFGSLELSFTDIKDARPQ